MPYTHFENDRYEALQERNLDCIIKDKIHKKFYFKKNYDLEERGMTFNKESISWNCKDSIVVIFILVSFFCMLACIINVKKVYNVAVPYRGQEYTCSIIFILLNIVIHECAHIVMMRVYGRQEGKVKLKLYWVFPCIVTDTSDSYMLPRYRRAFVYYAGIMINWIVCGIFFFFIPKYIYLLRAEIWLLLYNMIPFGGIKTDGYYVIVNSMLNIREMKQKRNVVSEILRYLFIIFSVFYICASLWAII